MFFNRFFRRKKEVSHVGYPTQTGRISTPSNVRYFSGASNALANTKTTSNTYSKVESSDSFDARSLILGAAIGYNLQTVFSKHESANNQVLEKREFDGGGSTTEVDDSPSSVVEDNKVDTESSSFSTND